MDNVLLEVTTENITFIRHDLKYSQNEGVDLVNIGKSATQCAMHLMNVNYKFTWDLYNAPAIAKLYKERDKFDVVLVHFFNNEVRHLFFETNRI